MVARGAVYWIDLDRRRPCVVVSSPDVLAVDVWQTHVVPLTSNLDRAGLAGTCCSSRRQPVYPETR